MKLLAIFCGCLFFAVLPEYAAALIMKLMSLAGIATEMYPFTIIPDKPECHTTKCPEPRSKEWTRLQNLCCENSWTFHCQITDKNDHGVRLCMTPSVTCPAGHYADMQIIRERRYPKEPLCYPCPALEFQPKPTMSHMFLRPECHHRRKLCRSLHAINIQKGTSSTDNVCKCAHYLGYRPVPVGDNKCIEFNSTSGCRCIHDPCPDGFTMTATTYQCVDESLARSIDSLGASGKYDGVIQDIVTGFITKPGGCEGVHCLDRSPQTWMSYLRSLHEMYGLVVPLALGTVTCAAYLISRALWPLATKGNTKYDILVCIRFTSGKVCERVYDELQNALPFLERLYGRLSLSHDPEANCIAVIVRPRLCKQRFSLLQFVRDLLSSASTKRDLADNADAVKIIALHGSSTDVRRMKSNLAALYVDDYIAGNAGKITLRFASGDVEDAILEELVKRRVEIEQLFSEYQLRFRSVQRGSITFYFDLPHSSETFDSLAVDRMIDKIVDRLLTLESFRRTASEQEVNVHVTVKGHASPSVSVVQSENLLVQIGARNTVHVCSPGYDCLHENAEEDNDSDDDDGAQSEAPVGFNATVSSIRVLRFRPLRDQGDQAQLPAELENGFGPEDTKVTVKCNSAETAQALHKQWTNVMPLLNRLHPSSRLLYRDDNVVTWAVRTRGENAADITTFVNDIFSLKRVKLITAENQPDVTINPPDNFTDRAVMSLAVMGLRNGEATQRTQEPGGMWTFLASSLEAAVSVGLVHASLEIISLSGIPDLACVRCLLGIAFYFVGVLNSFVFMFLYVPVVQDCIGW